MTHSGAPTHATLGPATPTQVAQSLAAACGMYVMWGGVLPLYWRNVVGIGPLETLAHRILWGALLVLLTSGPSRCRATVGALWRDTAHRRYAVLSAAVIGSNWLIYIWGVRNSHMTEASLGYYIGPLFSMMLGRLVLKERLRPLQWLACATAAAGVVYLVVARGVTPVFGLALAATFAVYGLLRKLSGLRGMQGFIVETAFLVPFAAGMLVTLHLRGEAQFAAAPRMSQLLLMGSGLFGSVPIVLFGVAAQHLALTTLGMLQFLAPTLGLVMAVFAFGEALTPTLWVAFGAIWLALALWIADSAWATRRSAEPRRP